MNTLKKVTNLTMAMVMVLTLVALPGCKNPPVPTLRNCSQIHVSVGRVLDTQTIALDRFGEVTVVMPAEGTEFWMEPKAMEPGGKEVKAHFVTVKVTYEFLKNSPWGDTPLVEEYDYASGRNDNGVVQSPEFGAVVDGLLFLLTIADIANGVAPNPYFFWVPTALDWWGMRPVTVAAPCGWYLPMKSVTATTEKATLPDGQWVIATPDLYTARIRIEATLETDNGKLVENVPTTISVHSDTDGFPNWYEELMGTDPFNSDSYPGVVVPDGTFRFKTNPASQAVAEGTQNLKFPVEIENGVLPINYKWVDGNGADIANNTEYNANTANQTLNSATQALEIVYVAALNAGGYQCVATDATGAVATSSVATLTVLGGGEGEGEGEGEGTSQLTIQYSGAGSVALNPAGSNADEFHAWFNTGQVVTATATADTGWHFVQWLGASTSSSSAIDLTMDGHKTIMAVFAEDGAPLRYSLTSASFGGEGYVNAKPADNSPPEQNYLPGTVLRLEAIPEAGYLFDHWDGDLTGSTNPTTITMDGNKVVNAYFRHTAPGDVPVITDKPADVVANLGDVVSFTVGATGEEPLSYVARHNEVPIPLADNPTAHSSTLTLTVTESSYGSYDFIVTNAYGSSDPALARAVLRRPSDVGNAQQRVFYDAATDSARVEMVLGNATMNSLFIGWTGSISDVEIFRFYSYAVWHSAKAMELVENTLPWYDPLNPQSVDQWVLITKEQLESLANQAGRWVVVENAKSGDPSTMWTIIDEVSRPTGGWGDTVNNPLTNWGLDTNNPYKQIRGTTAVAGADGTSRYLNTGQCEHFANGVKVTLGEIACFDHVFLP